MSICATFVCCVDTPKIAFGFMYCVLELEIGIRTFECKMFGYARIRNWKPPPMPTGIHHALHQLPSIPSVTPPHSLESCEPVPSPLSAPCLCLLPHEFLFLPLQHPRLSSIALWPSAVLLLDNSPHRCIGVEACSGIPCVAGSNDSRRWPFSIYIPCGDPPSTSPSTIWWPSTILLPSCSPHQDPSAKEEEGRN